MLGQELGGDSLSKRLLMRREGVKTPQNDIAKSYSCSGFDIART